MLVIIGVLLGGIMKGQEMVTQAKIKNAIAEFAGLTAVHSGYFYRYRALPGDDRGAATRWSAAPAAISGNGDGVISGTYNNGGAACTNAVEACGWWDHLRRAGFVSGSGPAQPFNAFTGIFGVQTGNAAGGPVLGGINALVLCSTNVPEKIAAAVDIQMDDGVPATGSVRAMLQLSANPGLDNSVPAAYAETGTGVYVLCRAFDL